jgi:asparagine synthase (glutamine-hydrolysing)
MCGIGGWIAGRGAQPDRAALERMLRALHHRGPDDSGVVIVEGTGLVHARLSIVDPSPAGHQPMADPSGRVWLTYNGEVFNHLDLREELPPIGYEGGSDTETLLHALVHWGEAAVPRCNGLYAYGAVDLDRRRALLVRDRFGVKPLYYARHKGALLFASEVRALLAAGVARRPDDALVRQMITAGWVNGPDMEIEGVHRLLPGRLLSIDIDTLATRETAWYEPADAVDPDRARQLESLRREEQARLLREELRASVSRRLMGDVPIGVMCSGGLDSSLVSALAAEERPRVHAFNVAVADQPRVDEGPWAEKVAEALGLELHTFRMTAESWRARLVETTCHNEHALVHESSVAMAHLAQLARDDGVKVLLSGEGADELFGGYEWLHAAEYRDVAARDRRLESLARSVYRWVQHRRSGEGDDSSESRWERRVRSRALAAYRRHSGARGRLEAALLGDLSGYLPHLLNRQDKNTMQCSIETRVPFLDPNVVALAVNLPLESRIEPERKALLREASQDLLPAAVIERPKIGFGFDIDAYLEPALRRDFLASGMLREVLGAPAAQWGERVARLSSQPLLLHVTGEIWCRALLDGQSEQAIDREIWL